MAARTTTKRKPAAKAKVPAKRTASRTRRARPKGPGQPTALTPATQASIVRLIAVGNYFETAVRSAGLAPSTVYAWRARGRREIERRAVLDAEHVEPGTADDEAVRIVRDVDPETWDREVAYVEFSEAVEKAEADAEAYAVTTLRSLMGPDHDGQVRARAALNYLERKHPRRWSRAERSEISVDSTSRVEVILPTEEEQKERTAETLAVMRSVGLPALVSATIDGTVGDPEDAEDD